jgi:hypothetical protein
MVKTMEKKRKVDRAELIKEIANENYPQAELNTLVMDNLRTHSEYDEIEFNVLNNQCLARRIDSIAKSARRSRLWRKLEMGSTRKLAGSSPRKRTGSNPRDFIRYMNFGMTLEGVFFIKFFNFTFAFCKKSFYL